MDKLADLIEAQLLGETEPIVQDRPIPVEAQLLGEAKPIVQDRPIPVKAEKKIDSWFFRIAVGAANNIYPEELQDVLDELEDIPDINKISFNFDFSLYRSLSDRKTMIGFTYNGSGDAYEFKGDELNFYQYLFGISLIHYPGNIIGNGLYVRGDLGTAFLIFDSSFGNAEQSENGFGYQLGAGYSLPTAIGIEFDAMLSYGGKKIEDKDYSVVLFNFGVSF
ncbi:hypothetical protein E3V36_02040 [Candidatus Marinimicrobia bacterium MT.SAG.2]|nr:hypothetical protein E3V36_02040 [Candidatus Marinimicrobia bacterium MT.SAG.2]